MKPILLDFIGIGARKSGTTWLSQCLAEHPEINFAKNKETNFFLSENFIKSMHIDPVLGDPVRFIKIHNENELSKEFTLTEGQIKGEFSPYYLYDSNSINKIKSYCPNAKLIVILRNPIEAIYSNYWFDRSSGQKDFPETFELALERFPHYKTWMLYYKLLKPYFESFGKENVLVILHDDIRANPSDVLVKTFRYLNVASDFVPPSTSTKVNKAQEVKSKKLAIFSRFIANILVRLHLRVIIGSLFGIYSTFNKRNISYPKMDAITKNTLKKYFENDVKNLQELIGRDLSIWKIF